MTRRAWVRLDNASNIFLAARTDADPKVFRLTAELDHDVDPIVLQDALDATYERYPLYHAVLRRGVFWHYLQDSDLRPVVGPEDQYTSAPIYHPDRVELLFRVVYHRRRIVLEVFHALSDGTGALWFLTDLVEEYVTRRLDGSTSTTPQTPARTDADAKPTHGLTDDSFGHYFRRRRRELSRRHADTSAEHSVFSGAAVAPALRIDPGNTSTADDDVPLHEYHQSPRKVFRVTGTRTPDNRPRMVEFTLPAKEVLALAKAEGVSLTMYLLAVFFESVRGSSGDLGDRRTFTASVPVNLRQFFPSTSARNFFATVRVEHTYGTGADDFGSICRELETQLREKVTPDALEKKLRRFIRLERMPALRVLPRPFKDAILATVNWGTNRGLTVAISNLGVVRLPEPAESHVGRMLFHVSAVRPQFCAISHAGLLTISFTSPFTDTAHIKEFARILTTQGVEVSVAATRVTEEELAGATP